MNNYPINIGGHSFGAFWKEQYIFFNYTTIPIIKFLIKQRIFSPVSIGSPDRDLLDPRKTYDDPAEWDRKARDLAQLFIANFEKFTDNEAGKALLAAGPQVD